MPRRGPNFNLAARTGDEHPLRLYREFGAAARPPAPAGRSRRLLKHRVAFYNFWKPLKRTVEERPLAMCDVTSSTHDDFITMKLRYRDRDGEIFVMRYSPKHHWWYFPRMTPDQS